MRKMIFGLVLVAAIMAIGGTAWSFDFQDHVKMAPNGKGDLLIYPFYAAVNGGWESKIWVINTTNNRSVVAKVIIRSAKNSVELRDFLIYLTPTDVWTGVIRYVNGAVEIYSTDDSVRVSSGVFATAATPLKINLESPLQASCQSVAEPLGNMIGYVEIIEAAHTGPGATAYVYPRGGSPTVNLNNPGVNKLALEQAYCDALGSSNCAGGVAANNPFVQDTINVLAGHMEFRNPTLGQNSTLPATVIRDYDNITYLTHARTTTIGGANESNNSLGEIEAALSKNNLAMPYWSKTATVHVLTFPTKQTNIDSTDCYYTSSPSPFFTKYAQKPLSPRGSYNAQWETWGCVPYNAVNYDLSEKPSVASGIFSPSISPFNLCGEVNYLTGFAFDEGWAMYNFFRDNTSYNTPFDAAAPGVGIVTGANNDGTFTGAPVIGTILHMGADGLTMLPAAYSDGRVSYNGADGVYNTADDVQYYYYQYMDEANYGSDMVTLQGMDADDGGQQSGNRAGWNIRQVPAVVIDNNHPIQRWP